MKHYLLYIAQILALSIFVFDNLSAQQDTSAPAKTVCIGITAGYALNRQTANFPAFDGYPLFVFREGGVFPPNFREGIGNGIFAGVLTNLPLQDNFSLSLRATFVQHNSTLTTRESVPIRTDTASYSIHSLTTSLNSVGLEVFGEYDILGSGLKAQLGVRGAYLLAPTFSSEEQFFSSNNQSGFDSSTFSRVRSVYSTNKPLSQASPIQIHALAGLGYTLHLTEKLWITPELHYAFAVTNALQPSRNQPSEPSQWSLHQFRGGVTVSLPLPEAPKLPPPPPPPIDTVKPAPILAIKAFGVNEGDNSTETGHVTLRVQQTISRSVFPLLPYVFFDGVGSTTIPDRYALLNSEEISAFKESKLSSAYELTPKEHSYYHVLNVVGERLRRLPNATLSIHGCTDGITAEKNRSDVAKTRGRVVMRYLKEVWGIEESRLKLIETSATPVNPSLPLQEVEKQVENRRVELRSDVAEILENITLIDTVRRVSPPVLRFRTSLTDLYNPRSWRIAISQKGRLLREFSGRGTPPETVDWRVDERELAVLKLDSLTLLQSHASLQSLAKELEYSFSCTDTDGNTFSSSTNTIPLETRTEEQNSKRTRTSTFIAGKLIERYNLILFDFAKSAITSEQTPMMNLMKSRITPRSTVRVDGFTDRTGDPEFNRKLSYQRALNVAQALNFSEDRIRTNVIGYGAGVELYDNELPEGRFYSRTVRVIVETPQSE